LGWVIGIVIGLLIGSVVVVVINILFFMWQRNRNVRVRNKRRNKDCKTEGEKYVWDLFN